MDDLSYILLDSGGSVHMLSKSCLATTAKLLREIPVEPLQVSVANYEVLCVSRFGLVELWLPCCQVEIHFEAYLSPTSISIPSTGTLQTLGFDVWHQKLDPLLQLHCRLWAPG